MSKILVVVDMQNDFLTGTLANESAVKIVPNILREIKSGDYDRIIFTRDTHNENYLNTQEGKNLPVIHCIHGVGGWRITDELHSPAWRSQIPVTSIDKYTFGYKDWGKRFKFDENDEITITGTIASICVVSNALILKATFPETPMRCIADCVADLTEEKKNAALSVMESCQIEVIR